MSENKELIPISDKAQEIFEEEIIEDVIEENPELKGKRLFKKLPTERIKAYFEKFHKKSRETVSDKSAVRKILESAIETFDDMSDFRIIGKYFKDLSLICSMINDYIQKKYTKLPMTTVVTLLSAVIYFVTPWDAIPDLIPFIGHIDDAFVLFCIRDALKKDIKKYKKWKSSQPVETEAVFTED